MRPTLFSKLIVAVMITLTLSDIVKAGEAKTIPISVTIPAIPGVNAPAIQEDSARKVKIEDDLTSKVNENKNNSNTSTIQEDEVNTTLAKVDEQTIRTIYSR